MRFPIIGALRRSLRVPSMLTRLQQPWQRHPFSPSSLALSFAVTLAWGLFITWAAYSLSALALL